MKSSQREREVEWMSEKGGGEVGQADNRVINEAHEWHKMWQQQQQQPRPQHATTFDPHYSTLSPPLSLSLSLPLSAAALPGQLATLPQAGDKFVAKFANLIFAPERERDKLVVVVVATQCGTCCCCCCCWHCV